MKELHWCNKILDWLEMKNIQVRTPLLYGSKEEFTCGPKQEDEGDEEGPSDLRELVLKAMGKR